MEQNIKYIAGAPYWHGEEAYDQAVIEGMMPKGKTRVQFLALTDLTVDNALDDSDITEDPSRAVAHLAKGTPEGENIKRKWFGK